MRPAAAALALLLAPPAPAAETSVAVVNGTPIPALEYQRELSSSLEYMRSRQPQASLGPDALKKLEQSTLEELISRELLYEQSVKEGIQASGADIDEGMAEIKARFAQDANGNRLSLDQARRDFEAELRGDHLTLSQFRDRLAKQIMARKLVNQEVRSKVQPPAEKEVRAAFKILKTFVDSGKDAPPSGMDADEAEQFMDFAGQVKAATAERVRVSLILLRYTPGASLIEKTRALRDALDVRRRLLQGTSTFAQVAAAESEDPASAPRGGDLGYLRRGELPAVLDRTIFTLPVGRLSDPVATDLGYNLVQVQDKRAATGLDYPKLKDDLAKYVENVEFKRDLDAYMNGLRAKASIQRDEAVLQPDGRQALQPFGP